VRNRFIASRILNLAARWRCGVSMVHWPLAALLSGKDPSTHAVGAWVGHRACLEVWRRGIAVENWKRVPEVEVTVRLVFVLGKTNPKLFGFHLVFLGAFAILRKVAFEVVTSVRARGTTRLPLQEFS
jgi:hypothetical protein